MESRNTAQVVAAIARTIAPHVGESMARAGVEGHRAKLGLSSDRLSEEDVEALLRKVGRGLVIFLGEQRTSEAIAAARAAVWRGPSGLDSEPQG